MKDLLEKAAVSETSQHQSTAEDILKSEESSQIVAFLLKSYFGSQASESTKSGGGRRNNENKAEARQDNEDGEEGGRSRRRRRRRGGRGRDGERGGNEGGRREPKSGDQRKRAAREESSAPTPAPEEGMRHLKVNLGFDDGFKGRGAIAKKITSLAGLNDGIVSEVESKRHHAVLKTTPEVAELLVERVDGAQIGKKILSLSMSEQG